MAAHAHREVSHRRFHRHGARPGLEVVERERRAPQVVSRGIRRGVEPELDLDAVEVALRELAREPHEERLRRQDAARERLDHRDGDAVVDVEERGGAMAVRVQQLDQLVLRVVGGLDRLRPRVDRRQRGRERARRVVIEPARRTEHGSDRLQIGLRRLVEQLPHAASLTQPKRQRHRLIRALTRELDDVE